jgi:protein-disulfide isomerase
MSDLTKDPEINEAAQSAPSAPSADDLQAKIESEKAAPAATVSRETFNYVVIAFVCLILGGLIGYVGRDRAAVNNDALIDRAVQTVVAAVPRGPTPVPTRDPNVRYPVEEKGNPVRGADNPDAPITIIAFGDFMCSFCRRFELETMPQILETYPGQVRYVYRDYPILGANSVSAAHAAECANDQGYFWEFHDWAFANQNALNREGIIRIAESIGMDMTQFTTCFDGQIHEQSILEDYLDGQALGVTGTPTFFINGKIVQGAQPFAVFRQVIDAELAEISAAG